MSDTLAVGATTRSHARSVRTFIFGAWSSTKVVREGTSGRKTASCSPSEPPAKTFDSERCFASWSRALVRVAEAGLLDSTWSPFTVGFVPSEAPDDPIPRRAERIESAMEKILERRSIPPVHDDGAKAFFSSKDFPPLDPEHLACLSRRVFDAVAIQPAFKELCDVLLGHGGLYVVAPPRSPDPDVDAILVGGRSFDATSVERVSGRALQCHRDVSRLWVEDPERVTIVVGYALCSDGLWRRHTWGFADDRVVETSERRLAYFGVPLSHEEATRFVSANG